MSDIATLALKVDSSSVPEGVKQLDSLEKAGARAEQQTQKLGITTEQAQRYMQKASVVLGDMKAKEEAAALAAEKLSQAQNSVAAAGGKVVASAGAQRAGMQQLGYQLGDVAQGFAMGQKPMQIFAQQGGQVLQSIQLMLGGSSRLAAFIGGPWGIAIMAGATVLVPFIAKLFDTSEALKQVEADAAAAADRLAGLVPNSTLGDLAEVTGKLNRLREEEKKLQDYINKQPKDPNGQPMFSYKQQQELAQVRSEILKYQDAYNKGNAALADQDRKTSEAMLADKAKLLGATTALDRAQAQYNISIREAQDAYDKSSKSEADQAALLNQRAAAERALNEAQDANRKANSGRAEQNRLATLAREAAATEELIKQLNASADAYLKSESAGRSAEIAAKATAEAIQKRGDVEQFISRAKREAVAQETLDGARIVAALKAENDARTKNNTLVEQGYLTAQEADQALQDEAQLRSLVTAAAMAEGEAKQKLWDIIAALRKEQTRSNEELRRERDQAGKTDKEDDLSFIMSEIELTDRLGKARIEAMKTLTGGALSDALADINRQRENELILLKATYEAAELEKQGLYEYAKATMAAAEAQVVLNNTQFHFDQQAEDIERANASLREMIDLLHNIGGLGSVLGGLLGIASGNYNSLGGGQLGDLLSAILNQDNGKGKKIGDDIRSSLEGLFKDVFGKDGLMGQTFSDALQNAGLGMAGASAVFGNQNTAQSIGSALGGIAGEVAGKAIGKAIGGIAKDIGGPVGAILGGILGSALGGLFGGSKKGSVTLNGMSITGTRYGNDARLDAANQNATSIIDSLTRIADALGGTLGSVSGVSIGMRNDSWRVDPTGQGRVKGSGVLDFGKDAEAAAMAAMKLLIERGVIGGIRASTQNILKAGTDLETQINKALAWESILKEAEHASSSFSSALKDLQDSFVEINKIAIEAKASTEELAEVQGLLIRKQQELIDQAMQSYRSTFYTDAENVAYAKKTISSTLTPLGYGNVDTVEEYKALVAATDALKDPELFGALMDLSDEFGVLKDSADQAKAAAEQQAAQEKALAAQRGQLTVQILQAQGKAAEALAKQRALELEAADASLRPLLQQLYKAQDIATAKDALSDAYKRESAALQDVIDQTDKAVETWQAFSDSLAGSAATAVSTSALLVKFMAAASAADTSDPSKLTGAGTAYLDALRNTATSYTQYQRGVGVVRGMTAQAIGTAAQQGTVAQQQLDQMKTQVGALIDINESVLSVEDAIERLTALVDPATPTGGGGLNGPDVGGKLDELRDRLKDVIDGLHLGRGRADHWGQRSEERLSAVEKFLKAVTRDGSSIIVATDSDTPLAVTP